MGRGGWRGILIKYRHNYNSLFFTRNTPPRAYKLWLSCCPERAHLRYVSCWHCNVGLSTVAVFLLLPTSAPTASLGSRVIAVPTVRHLLSSVLRHGSASLPATPHCSNPLTLVACVFSFGADWLSRKHWSGLWPVSLLEVSISRGCSRP